MTRAESVLRGALFVFLFSSVLAGLAVGLERIAEGAITDGWSTWSRFVGIGLALYGVLVVPVIVLLARPIPPPEFDEPDAPRDEDDTA